MYRVCFSFCLLLASGAAPTLAGQSAQPTPHSSPIPTSATPTPPPIPLQFNQNFSGDWVGSLEYRDYSATSPTAPHTSLPTRLTMRPSPDGRAVNLAFTYDDGPGKVVYERTILSFTADTALITGTSNAENQTFHVDGLESFRKTGFGDLTLTGMGQENDKPVEVRISLRLDGKLFTWLKETRPVQSSGDFVFRDAYKMTRTPTPASAVPAS